MPNTLLKLRTEMLSSYLIQRLHKPYPKVEGPRKDNPFSFGGGLKNGGLSPEAMDLLRGVWEFDYMGASEFEWGAVPAALHFLAEQVSNQNVVIGELETEGGVVYYLCPKPYEEEAKKRILLARQGKLRTKENVGLKEYFDGSFFKPKASEENYYKRIVGWLEIDNGYLFFTDKPMFGAACKLFGVKVEAPKDKKRREKRERFEASKADNP